MKLRVVLLVLAIILYPLLVFSGESVCEDDYRCHESCVSWENASIRLDYGQQIGESPELLEERRAEEKKKRESLEKCRSKNKNRRRGEV